MTQTSTFKGRCYTVEPPYNEGPRDWQNAFAITRFRYIKLGFFSIYFTITGAENIVRYTEDFVNNIEIRYIEVPL